MNITKEIEKLKCGKLYKEVSLNKHTTYRINEKALGLVIPNSVNDLKKILDFLKKNNIKHKIIGNGSNLIFDGYYNGILIKLNKLDNLEINGASIKVESGYSLIKLAYKVAKLGLTGLEFASGIPGTVGGAIYMNAGAYNSDMGYIVSEVKVLTPDLEIKTIKNKDLNFHYRDSFFQHNEGYICLEAIISLKIGKASAIMEVINDRKERRLASQPLEYPSAGSVFRNPTNDYAGRLVEDIGYKGKSINDAAVSEKHANFIINLGDAKGEDIIKLITEIKQEVKKKHNIDLKLEQEIVK